MKGSRSPGFACLIENNGVCRRFPDCSLHRKLSQLSSFIDLKIFLPLLTLPLICLFVVEACLARFVCVLVSTSRILHESQPHRIESLSMKCSFLHFQIYVSL